MAHTDEEASKARKNTENILQNILIIKSDPLNNERLADMIKLAVEKNKEKDI